MNSNVSERNVGTFLQLYSCSIQIYYLNFINNQSINSIVTLVYDWYSTLFKNKIESKYLSIWYFFVLYNGIVSSGIK